MIGETLSRYRILERIGVGGMGEVYRAQDTVLERPVAVKVLRSQVADNAAARTRFDREVRAVASLSHPNILAIHDYGVERGIVFAVMELLEGTTLRAQLREGPLGLAAARDIGLRTAQGLAAAHAKQIVHRDLKPENLFVTNQGELKILDFGLAKFVASGGAVPPGGLEVTQAGTVLGTAPYMSPQQLAGC